VIEKLTADTSIDGVSTGRRPIDSREIDLRQQQQQVIDQSTAERSIDGSSSIIQQQQQK
jgi:hypothetical protein